MSLASYTKTVWANGGTPAINDTNLGKIEQRLYDLTEEAITPSYEADATVTAEVTSLASTIIDAPYSTAYIEGKTLANLLSDNVAGAEATAGWTASSGSVAIDSSNEFEGTNCLKFTLGAASDTYDYDIFSLLEAGKYYFLSAHIKIGDATNINLEFETDDQDVITSNITSTTYTRVGVVIQPTDFDTAASAVIRFNVTGSAAEYVFADAIMLQEISSADYALGATSLLSKYAYHRGIQGSNPQIVKSVGKNLHDNVTTNWKFGYYLAIADGAETVDADSAYTRDYISVNASTAYIFSHTNSLENYIFYYDEQKNYITYVSGTGTSRTFTTPANCRYIRLMIFNTGLANIDAVISENMQLEKGAVATTYEAYKKTSTIVPVSLHGVDDSIADKFDCITGRHTQNVTYDSDISGTDYDSIDTGSYVNVDVVKTTAFSTMIAQSTSADGTTKVLNSSKQILSEVSQANIDLVASVGKYYTHTDETVWFIVANGAYADIGAARTGLGTSQIVYQIATPIVTDYYPNALNSAPNGTIYVEPAIADYDFYNSGAYVTDTTYPISSLRYVNTVNKTTGALTPLDLSSCTIAADGLSFTSTDITDADLVDFVYNYVNLSSIPSLTYATVSNLKASVVELNKTVARLDEEIEDVDLSVRNEIQRLIDNQLRATRSDTINIAMGGWRLG